MGDECKLMDAAHSLMAENHGLMAAIYKLRMKNAAFMAAIFNVMSRFEVSWLRLATSWQSFTAAWT